MKLPNADRQAQSAQRSSGFQLLIGLFVLRNQNIANQVGIINKKNVSASHFPVDDVAKLAGHPFQEAHWIFAKPQESTAWIAGFGAGRKTCHTSGGASLNTASTRALESSINTDSLSGDTLEQRETMQLGVWPDVWQHNVAATDLAKLGVSRR